MSSFYSIRVTGMNRIIRSILARWAWKYLNIFTFLFLGFVHLLVLFFTIILLLSFPDSYGDQWTRLSYSAQVMQNKKSSTND